MPTIKIPMTEEKHDIENCWTYVAMDANGKWYTYAAEPRINSIEWGGVCAHLTDTPELPILLNWEEMLFTVEELLCRPSKSL